MGADFLCGVAVHCPSMQGVLQNAPWMYSRWDLTVSLSLSGAQACRCTSHKRGWECADLTSQGASPAGKRDEFGVSGYCSFVCFACFCTYSCRSIAIGPAWYSVLCLCQMHLSNVTGCSQWPLELLPRWFEA